MDSLTAYLDGQDIAALLFFILCWGIYALYSERSGNNLLAVTNRYRALWMREMMRRDNRGVDAIMIGNLQRSITFFANITLLLVVGLIGMLGYHDRASPIFSAIPFAKPSTPLSWELKIVVLMLIFIYAFFKYTWSMRLYNYAIIFISGAPRHDERVGEHDAIAARAGQLISNAATHFNNGLRAYYFGMATLAWFIHPYLFMIATAWVVAVTYRREYRSRILKHLAQAA